MADEAEQEERIAFEIAVMCSQSLRFEYGLDDEDVLVVVDAKLAQFGAGSEGIGAKLDVLVAHVGQDGSMCMKRWLRKSGGVS